LRRWNRRSARGLLRKGRRGAEQVQNPKYDHPQDFSPLKLAIVYDHALTAQGNLWQTE
jgi:hypothetical protein